MCRDIAQGAIMPLPEVFSDEWCRACAARINAHEGYRQSGAGWADPVVLVLRPEAGNNDVERAVYLDLVHGHCREARSATAADRENAAWVIAARQPVWERMLAGALHPIPALMQGKLRLEKGSLFSLMPHARAAAHLVAAAAQVAATFPGGAIIRDSKAESDPLQPDQDLPEPRREKVSAVTMSPPAPHARPPRATGRPLAWNSPPMRLWQKAKKLGVWDPQGIDFRRDAEDWQRLMPEERDLILRLTAQFHAGEEAVTLELLPLIMAVAAEGRLEEEIYLTSFLFEEAKHTEVFARFLSEVVPDAGDLSRYHSAGYRRIFHEALPRAMQRLRTDSSPEAQAEASVTYNMIVEGVLAETGYHAFDRLLRDNGIMPGMQEVVAHLRRDESRHLAYGVFLLSRLSAEHGEPVWHTIDRLLGELLAPAIDVVQENFSSYDPVPFGLRLKDFVDFATAQFGRRAARLERARSQTLAEVLGQEAKY
jgi:ribonucleoside-diphosphate reductase beta chain